MNATQGIPMGSSPAAMHSGNPGAQANAIAKLREAIKLIELALPDLPPEEKGEVAKCISILSKKFPDSEASPGIQQTALRDLAQKAQQQQMMQALMRQQPQPGAGAPQPQAA